MDLKQQVVGYARISTPQQRLNKHPTDKETAGHKYLPLMSSRFAFFKFRT
jgi:hypothetical protein